MLTMKVKTLFFDRAAVMDAVGPARVKSLSKAGAFIRQSARSSIRRRKRISNPGEPPSAHSKDAVASIKNILFAYDPGPKSVVVGPVGLNMLTSGQPGIVPNVLEFGGRVKIFERQRRDGTWTRADLRSRRKLAGVPTRNRSATYEKRPYMGPALQRESPKLANFWRDSIVRAA